MKQFDLIVVGAGVLGSFHAYHAARMGKKVLLTEKDPIPNSATVRNFGQIVPSGLRGKWFEHGVNSIAVYKALQKEFDLTVRQNGTLYIASDEDEQTLIHEALALYRDRHYEVHLLSQKQVLKKYPALQKSYVREALCFPQEVSVEPQRMIHRLLEYLSAKFPQLTYLPDSAVVECTSTGQGVRVTLANRQRYRADRVIICSGSEFRILFPEIFKQSGIVVNKLQMMRSRPMPQVQLEGNILSGLSIRRYESFQACPSFPRIIVPPHYEELQKWGIHLLFKKGTDGSFIIGDSHEYADCNHAEELGFRISQSINELILQEAARIVNFDVRNIECSWAGYYSQHPEFPVFEYDIDHRIHIRTAIGGKGMTSGAGYAAVNLQRLYA